MAGTIIITGANGSLAGNTVQHLLTNTPDNTLVLTVRNTSDEDPNTKKLRATIAKFPNAKVSIRQLDLANLTAVHEFADTVAAEAADKKLPSLAAIVCNAYYWNMVRDPELSDEGYEKSIHINHISHAALVLRLLGSFGPEGGRVVLFTSDAHEDGKNGLQKYPPALPDGLDALLKAVPESDKQGRGFLNYANSKLAILMWTYALNRYLEKDEALSKITAIAIDPGSLVDSRALRTNTPPLVQWVQKLVLQPFRPVLRFVDPYIRTAADAGVDVAELALNQALPGERGYLKLLKRESSSKDSLDEVKQEKLWAKTLEWAKITKENTLLESGV
ncbi:Uu.00g050410.m01.CDS01 [Anthostomella pinea]|uniref:3beta-hydroxysteroid 3-dehydrogenase n=1 Tax=Anthostomella pinea TaxID=933095 RepID=A0AAI8YMI4_9PEZI|nr:Uu.00g050410.m01.CDS01 [Anthostomella pinea]